MATKKLLIIGPLPPPYHGTSIYLESVGKASLEIIKNYTPEKAAKIKVKTIEFVLEEK